MKVINTNAQYNDGLEISTIHQQTSIDQVVDKNTGLSLDTTLAILKEDINDLKIVSKNNYASLSNLGLDSTTTIEKLIQSMPNNSTFSCSINSSDMTTILSQCPYDYGTLTIEKVTIARTIIKFTTARNIGSPVQLNDSYYCNFDSALLQISEWNQINTNDTGWIDLTLTQGSSVSGYTVQYRKIGKIVTLKGRITNLSTIGNIGELPIGFFSTIQRVFLCAGTGTVVSKFVTYADGTIGLANVSETLTTEHYFCLDNISFVMD